MGIQRVQTLVRELGWSKVPLYLLQRGLHRLSGRTRLVVFDFYAQPVAAPVARYRHKPGGFEIRPVAEAEYQHDWFPRPPSVIADRYRQGALCLVAFKQGVPAGCLWLMFTPYREDVVRCRYQPQPAHLCGWDFDVFIHPQYRLGRLFDRLWDAANGELQNRGRRWSVSRIDAFNVDSIRSHRRLNARPCGRALFLVVGSQQLTLATVPPYAHWAGRGSGGPDFTVAVKAAPADKP